MWATRLLVVLAAGLGLSCAAATADSGSTLPRSMADLVAERGAPPIRFTVDARLADRLAPEARVLAALPADVRDLVRTVEFLGYYESADSIVRFAAINDVVISKEAVVIPELTVAEPGELGRAGRIERFPAGQGSAELVEQLGTPASYRRSDESEVLEFTVDDDLVIAFAAESQVWAIFTLRIAPDLEPNYREDLATIIMDAFVHAGSGLDPGRNREHVLHMLRSAAAEQ